MATRYNYTGGIVTNGLVLNLDAAKVDSYPGTGTTWRDLSGRGNNGTLTNGPTFSGIGKQASIVFDGVDDYVNVNSNPITGSSPSTVEFWMIPSVVTNTIVGEAFLQIGNPGSNQMRLYFFRNSKFAVAYYNNDFTFDYTAVVNTTYHAVFTENGSGAVQLYINGVLVSSGNLATPNTQGSGYQLGRYSGGPTTFFNGKMFSHRTYNKALSAQEVTQNFNALRGRYGI
jgi:hypothetical protein